MLFLKKAANLMLLTLLWLAACIPILTIGAATGAMYSVALKLATDEDDRILLPFWNAFRADFLKSTGLFVLILVFGAVALADYIFIARGLVSMPVILRTMATIPMLLFLLSVGYVFPLHAKFENTVFNTIKNSVLLSVRYFICSLAVLFLNGLPVIILLISETLFWQLSIIWITFGVAWIAYLQMKILNRWVFSKLVPSEVNESKEGADF